MLGVGCIVRSTKSNAAVANFVLPVFGALPKTPPITASSFGVLSTTALEKVQARWSKKMKEYDFTLKYRLGNADENAEKYIDALAMSGCEDAIIGVGQNGRISLNFIREAANALEAVGSAISDVQNAIPEAKLVEATPDYVGLSDIAELFGFSRQYMRKLIHNRGAAFPEPVHEGKPSLWHLSDILVWFRDHESREVQSEVFEISQIAMQLNLYNSCIKASAQLDNGFKFEVNAPDNALQGTLLRAARP